MTIDRANACCTRVKATEQQCAGQTGWWTLTSSCRADQPATDLTPAERQMAFVRASLDALIAIVREFACVRSPTCSGEAGED